MTTQRYFAILLALCFMLSFAACQDGDLADQSSARPEESRSVETSQAVPEESQLVETSHEIESSDPASVSVPDLEELSEEDYSLIGERLSLDTDDYREVATAFSDVLEKGFRAVPQDSRYAITDYILRDVVISTDDLERDADFRAYIKYAIKPANCGYYPLYGVAEEGEGELTGYVLASQGFYFKSDGNGNWECVINTFT